MEKEIIRYDERDNLIYWKETCGRENQYEYDERDNCVYIKSFFDKMDCSREGWKEYDKNNNLICYRDSYNYKFWSDYDEKNRKIHFKDNHNQEYWYRYGKRKSITEEEFNEKEYLSRKKVSRFEIMDI